MERAAGAARVAVAPLRLPAGAKRPNPQRGVLLEGVLLLLLPLPKTLNLRLEPMPLTVRQQKPSLRRPLPPRQTTLTLALLLALLLLTRRPPLMLRK